MSDFDPLDFKSITSLFLYGTPTPPAEIFDRVRQSTAQVSFSVDTSAFMNQTTGPGRYFLSTLARPDTFVSAFFEAAEGGSFDDLAGDLTLPVTARQYLESQFKVGHGIVRLTAQQLQANQVATFDNFFTRQVGWEPNTNDFMARTYIYNSEKFAIDPNTVFAFNLDDPAKSQIENLKIIPQEDNFDFVTGGTIAQLV